jgi:uncharacterized protein (TIGR02147 family)
MINIKKSLFQFKDYRDFLKEYIKLLPDKGAKSTLSTILGCKPSYLSKILAKNAHLSIDHAGNLAEHLNFDDEATEYFLYLVLSLKSNVKSLKTFMSNRMNKINDIHNQIDDSLIGTSTEGSTANYLAGRWYRSVIYDLLSMKELEGSAIKISKKLRLPESLINEVLGELKLLGLISGSSETGFAIDNSIPHLNVFPSSSVQNSMLMQFRNLASMRIVEMEKTDIFFTGVYTLDSESIKKVRLLVRDYIEGVSVINDNSSKESSSKEVFGINLDVYQI